MTVTTTGTIRASTYAMVKLLRTNLPEIQNRVYPQGEIISGNQTRITVRQLTPREQIASLGASVESFSILQMTLDVWDKKMDAIDPVADHAIQIIKQNRNYAPATITIGADTAVDPKGYFLMLSINGGSDTTFNSQMQCYHRSINVTGQWFQRS